MYKMNYRFELEYLSRKFEELSLIMKIIPSNTASISLHFIRMQFESSATSFPPRGLTA